MQAVLHWVYAGFGSLISREGPHRLCSTFSFADITHGPVPTYSKRVIIYWMAKKKAKIMSRRGSFCNPIVRLRVARRECLWSNRVGQTVGVWLISKFLWSMLIPPWPAPAPRLQPIIINELFSFWSLCTCTHLTGSREFRTCRRAFTLLFRKKEMGKDLQVVCKFGYRQPLHVSEFGLEGYDQHLDWLIDSS